MTGRVLRHYPAKTLPKLILKLVEGPIQKGSSGPGPGPEADFPSVFHSLTSRPTCSYFFLQFCCCFVVV